VDDALRLRLIDLETALARRDAAAIPGGFEAILDHDFSEVGSSGRIWDRAATLVILETAQPVEAVIDEVIGGLLSEDVALLVYRAAIHRGGHATWSRRASLWVRRDGEWRLHFHQGTPL